MKGLDDVARELVGLFESAHIPHAVMGGLAVRVHALPRPTFDVDFAAAIPRGDLPQLYQTVQASGYVVPDSQLTGWIDTVRGLPVIKAQVPVGDETIDVDVFLAETPFLRQVLSRRQRHRAEALDAWFVSAKDLILLKLLAGPPKDRVDVGDILFIQGALDSNNLRQWAVKLGVLDDLREAVGGQAS
jgi:hypothetical protein